MCSRISVPGIGQPQFVDCDQRTINGQSAQAITSQVGIAQRERDQRSVIQAGVVGLAFFFLYFRLVQNIANLVIVVRCSDAAQVGGKVDQQAVAGRDRGQSGRTQFNIESSNVIIRGQIEGNVYRVGIGAAQVGDFQVFDLDRIVLHSQQTFLRTCQVRLGRRQHDHFRLEEETVIIVLFIQFRDHVLIIDDKAYEIFSRRQVQLADVRTEGNLNALFRLQGLDEIFSDVGIQGSEAGIVREEKADRTACGRSFAVVDHLQVLDQEKIILNSQCTAVGASQVGQVTFQTGIGQGLYLQGIHKETAVSVFREKADAAQVTLVFKIRNDHILADHNLQGIIVEVYDVTNGDPFIFHEVEVAVRLGNNASRRSFRLGLIGYRAAQFNGEIRAFCGGLRLLDGKGCRFVLRDQHFPSHSISSFHAIRQGEDDILLSTSVNKQGLSTIECYTCRDQSIQYIAFRSALGRPAIRLKSDRQTGKERLKVFAYVIHAIRRTFAIRNQRQGAEIGGWRTAHLVKRRRFLILSGRYFIIVEKPEKIIGV